jgi:VanZ family protein
MPKELSLPKKNTLRVFLLYGCCVLAVLVFVNLFSLFAILREIFGKTAIDLAPIVLTLLSLALLLILTTRNSHKSGQPIAWPWMSTGAVIVCFALLIPDPEFAVKRIHVLEYLLLSLLVRYTLAQRISGLSLFIYGILFTVVLGMHDELLQGFHPQRTYGFRDIAVNSAAAVGGSCLWQGLELFTRGEKTPSQGIDWTIALYLLWLFLALVLFLLPLLAFKYQAIPLWTLLPLSSTLLLWGLLLAGRKDKHRHGTGVISLAAISVLFYPLLANVFAIPFY